MDKNEIGRLLQDFLDMGHGLAFMMTLDDRAAEKIVSEGVDLFFLRLGEPHLETKEDEFALKVRFFNCLYRSFLVHQGGRRPLESNDRSRHLQEIDSDIRGMLFLKHKALFDFEDLAEVFERDRHQIINDVALGREALAKFTGVEEFTWN